VACRALAADFQTAGRVPISDPNGFTAQTATLKRMPVPDRLGPDLATLPVAAVEIADTGNAGHKKGRGVRRPCVAASADRPLYIKPKAVMA
jgi:hypothetical protein